MLILALDTSTPRGSVALLDTAADALIFAEHFAAGRSHSSALFLALEKARAAAGGARLDQVAVGLGPGSYAGVRIGIAAAMGFQLAQGAALVGLPSVVALETDAAEFAVVGDARRDTFYFSHVHDGACVEGPLLLDAPALAVRLGVFSKPLLSTEPLPAAPAASVALPDATRLARLAARGQGIVQRDNLEPIYLREPHITQPKPKQAATPA